MRKEHGLKTRTADFEGWLIEKLKALEKERDLVQYNLKCSVEIEEDLRKQLQKLKEYTVHKSSCELVSLAFTHVPVEERKCTCGLDELLNQSHES